MTVLADFVAISHGSSASQEGKWKSQPFESGGRKTLIIDDKEQHNAYVTLSLGSPDGGPEVNIRVIVNNHPLPLLEPIGKDGRQTVVLTFPASLLKNGTGNILELHSQHEVNFFVFYALCHFRQDS
ncbi:hypothetical protein ABCR94_28460 [Streptomyces sp. 21So2-11]|uniref:hypothetical protein n=1 Tax=Streptomyces sp. 21So2-11 TaxID=3144408 RepID=UPI00321AC260